MNEPGTQLTVAILVLAFSALESAAQNDRLRKDDVTFLASFDQTLQAGIARGEKKSFVAGDLSRKSFLPEPRLQGVELVKEGRFGGALRFHRKTKEVFCYQARENFPYSPSGFDASISFWLKCSLDRLPQGYIDPLQITDKKWNDASLFVDFNDQRPPDFRLGVFSDLEFWNPDRRDFAKLKPEERPMVDAGKVNFSGNRWTHVCILLERINRSDQSARCRLYVDGKSRGELVRKQQLTWDLRKTWIMLGINYVGDLDDFAIFNKALTGDQVRQLAESDRPVWELLK